jgi:hypothetical protein
MFEVRSSGIRPYLIAPFVRRRAVALRIAEVGRSYGYGFPTGDTDDIDALRMAGLFEETDPEAHQAYWDAREPLA